MPLTLHPKHHFSIPARNPLWLWLTATIAFLLAVLWARPLG